MIFTMDIGNTNIKTGLFQGKELVRYWRLSTNRSSTSDEYGMLVTNLFRSAGLSPDQVTGIMLSSVVPPVNFTIEHMCNDYFGIAPKFVVPGVKTGINIQYDNPRALGSDRICNAVAVQAFYGAPCIFIDFGTATTFGVVDEKGNYVSSNEVLVLLYYYLLKYKGWRGAAVRNIATTHLLDRVAKAFGQECIEVPVGFKHISAGMDAHNALIGGESSGGLTVRGHISGKDGLYAASLLVEMLSVTHKPLSELVQELYTTYGELHMAEYDWALTPASRGDIARLLMEEKKLPAFDRPIEKVSYMDGCKVYFQDGGWIIGRFSGTEPRIRVFAESATLADARGLVQTLARFLGLSFKAE